MCWARENKYSMLKIPTRQQIASFNGMHCKGLWNEVGIGWHCPSCKRWRHELIRWTKISGAYWLRYADEQGYGFSTSIVRHHCHNTLFPRFESSIICGDCNSADGIVKARLHLPQEWSFSPSEIGQFTKGIPYGTMTIDYEAAQRLFNKLGHL